LLSHMKKPIILFITSFFILIIICNSLIYNVFSLLIAYLWFNCYIISTSDRWLINKMSMWGQNHQSVLCLALFNRNVIQAFYIILVF
jgi:hypothetical protein